MNNALEVKDLKKIYGDKEVVKGISFSLREGEIFGFLGPNGAGKTTSIRMMIGEIAKSGGEINIFGQKMPDCKEAIKNLIGVVPDYQNLYDRLTVRQNLEIFSELYGTTPERIDEVIKAVVLEEHQHKACSDLSRGLRQRTLIARGILHKPKLFFLDEPTSALDPQSALLIRELIKKLQSLGTTILITTHYMEEANWLCDRIAIMNRGEIIALNTPENLKMNHGKESIKVVYKDTESSDEKTKEIPMNNPEGSLELSNLVKQKTLIKIHSQEATLEEVFMNLTGNKWQEEE